MSRSLNTRLQDKSPEEIYEDFWKHLVEYDGVLNKDSVMNELADYHYLLDQIPNVYEHVTGGELSKVMYPSDTVIRLADDHLNATVEDFVEDAIKCQLDQDLTLEDVLDELEDWRSLASQLISQLPFPEKTNDAIGDFLLKATELLVKRSNNVVVE